jgi:Entner-Doudoroff aldolase
MSLSTSPLDVSPVIPVVVIDDPAHAVPLARALVVGGVSIIEVTLRTPQALDAVAAIAAEVPEIALGVGSVLTAAHVDQALAAGAEFLVSPGASPSLLQRLVAAPVPVGCTTLPVAVALPVAMKVTAKPELDVALTAKSGSPNVLCARAPNEIIWLAFWAVTFSTTAVAGL